MEVGYRDRYGYGYRPYYRRYGYYRPRYRPYYGYPLDHYCATTPSPLQSPPPPLRSQLLAQC